MCTNILHRYIEADPTLKTGFQEGKLSKEVIELCNKEVLDTCGVNVTELIMDKVRLSRHYKQSLDEIRLFNNSLCLKYNFGIDPGSLGAPRRMRLTIHTSSKTSVSLLFGVCLCVFDH